MKPTTQKLFFLPILLFVHSQLCAQNFSWRKGSNLTNQPGVYGTQGIPAPSNNPGAREAAATWKDSAGNFWLFGGHGLGAGSSYGLLNDLWRFNPVTNLWTFVKGDSIAGFNYNGIYGTKGIASALNKPPAKQMSGSWVDANGNFWLFGGDGVDSTGIVSSTNDLWRYNPLSNEWTWMSGSKIVNQPGTFGTLSVPAVANTPGARQNAACWTAATGNLWLFGGNAIGVINSPTANVMSDLWKYDTGSNLWTWVKGNGLYAQPGIYGVMGVPATANIPAGRKEAVTWTDSQGDLWLLGGMGFATSSFFGTFDDLWRYTISTNQWTWMNGTSGIDQIGSFGIQGLPTSWNWPGSRNLGMTWIDNSGNLYLFSGRCVGTAGYLDSFSDLWQYKTATNEWIWIKGTNIPTYGTYGAMGVPAPANIPGSRRSGMTWTDNANNLWLFGGYGYDSGLTIPEGFLNDVWKFTICTPLPTVTASSSNSLACADSLVVLTASGANSYTWSNTMTGPSIQIPAFNLVYTVVGRGLNGCMNSASVSQSVTVCTSIQDHKSGRSFVSIFPNPSKGEFYVSGDCTTLIVYNQLGQVALSLNNIKNDETLRTRLAKGIYYVQARNGTDEIYSGKLIIEN
jgi:N-acetylneuraminic acid mutarotase